MCSYRKKSCPLVFFNSFHASLFSLISASLSLSHLLFHLVSSIDDNAPSPIVSLDFPGNSFLTENSLSCSCSDVSTSHLFSLLPISPVVPVDELCTRQRALAHCTPYGQRSPSQVVPSLDSCSTPTPLSLESAGPAASPGLG